MRKRLGQHFLKNKKILWEIANAAELSKKEIVLEIGPGTGNLTEILAERARKVIAVEKDINLVTWNLKRKTWKNVKFIHGDILKPETWIKKLNVSSFRLHASRYKIVANIPYYITSRFLRLFLSNPKLRPKLMVLMVQKEVAERILAKDGKESLLSLSVKAYAKPKLICKVSRNYFSPKPRVDSAIIKLSNIECPTLEGVEEKKFFEILHIAFRQKRKMLQSSIGREIKLPPRYKTRRPENLSLKDWIFLEKSIVRASFRIGKI
jgi:16S rRNA (adenine1518-N6/adenine1519-N6)-dimethyltransferase